MKKGIGSIALLMVGIMLINLCSYSVYAREDTVTQDLSDTDKEIDIDIESLQTEDETGCDELQEIVESSGNEVDESIEPLASITMSESDYNSKVNSFIASHGSSTTCYSCFDYCCWFTQHMYGVNNYYYHNGAGEQYYNVNDIRAGDIIRIDADEFNYGHSFVVVRRDGNNLYTIEGNMGSSGGQVKISTTSPGYWISNGKICRNDGAHTFLYGFHFANVNYEVYGSNMEQGYARIIPDGDYQLVSAVNGALTSCLDVPGNNCNEPDGAQAQIWNVLGSEYDVFTLKFTATKENGTGFYTICHKGSDKALDVDGTGLARSTKIQYWEKNGWIAQDWAVSYAGDGFFYIQARANGFYLDVSAGCADNGTRVGIWDRNETNAQKWAFVPFGKSVGKTYEEGNYHIVHAKTPNLALGIKDRYINDENYHNAETMDNAWGRDSVFTLSYYADEGIYCIKHKASGRNLDLQKGGASENVGVWEGTETGAPSLRSQKWIIRKNGSNVGIISAFKGTYLDLTNDLRSEGTNIRVYECNNSDAESWKLVRAVDSIKLDKSETSLPVNGTDTLSETILPTKAENKSVTWWSDKPAVVSVDEDGNISALKEGTAIVYAQSVDGGYTASCKVTVNNAGSPSPSPNPTPSASPSPSASPTASASPSPSASPAPSSSPSPSASPAPSPEPEVIDPDAIMVVSQKLDLKPLFGRTYKKYSVSPKKSATINEKSILSAKKAGMITVTGYIKSNGKWRADSENAIHIKVEKPSFIKKTVTLRYRGATFNAADNLPELQNVPSSWKTSDKKIASIDSETGVITANKSGKVKITAVYGTKKKTAKYSFTVKVIIPKLSKKSVTMLTGASYRLKLYDASDYPEWTTLDDEIVDINDAGKIMANNCGKTTVFATLDGVEYKCTVTVKKPVLSAKKLTMRVGAKKKLTLTNTKLKEIEWTTSDGDVAYVCDDKGTIKAVGKGTAEIYTTTGGCTDKCIVTVK